MWNDRHIARRDWNKQFYFILRLQDHGLFCPGEQLFGMLLRFFPCISLLVTFTNVAFFILEGRAKRKWLSDYRKQFSIWKSHTLRFLKAKNFALAIPTLEIEKLSLALKQLSFSFLKFMFSPLQSPKNYFCKYFGFNGLRKSLFINSWKRLVFRIFFMSAQLFSIMVRNYFYCYQFICKNKQF